MPGKRFLIWRAVSSKKQAEEVSPHVQEEMARQHVAKWGGSVVDVLDVAESRDIAIVSDAADAIPAYGRLLDHIRQHTFDVLVCYDLSRLGRTHTLILDVAELCRRAGAVIYEIENPPHSLDVRHSYDDMLIRALKAVGYQHETMKTKERMRFGREGRAKKGELPKTPPYGYYWEYKVVKDEISGIPLRTDRSVQVDPEKAAVVRQIAEWYLAGHGHITIAAMLTARGIATPAGGAVWQKNSVRLILERAWTYAGYSEFYRARKTGYIRSPGTWAPLWDEATAERIEQELAARAANRRIADTPSRLTGIVLCDVCQKPMWQVRNETGEIREKRYDHCGPREDGYSRRRRAKFYCYPYHAGGSVGTDRILQALALAIEDLQQADLSAVPDEDSDRADQLAAQLATHDAAIARHQQGLRRADTAFVNGAMDEERYREQVTRLRTAIEAEQSTKTVLQAQADAATQRGSRAEMLAEVAAAGPAMLTLDDAAAANAWFRRYVRVFVRGNEVVEVRFDFW